MTELVERVARELVRQGIMSETRSEQAAALAISEVLNWLENPSEEAAEAVNLAFAEAENWAHLDTWNIMLAVRRKEAGV